jgi:hypothetical protein
VRALTEWKRLTKRLATEKSFPKYEYKLGAATPLSDLDVRRLNKFFKKFLENY